MAKLTVRSEPEYLLSLSRKEAQLLYFILRKIGGDPEDTPRGMADKILRELEGEVSLANGYFAEGSIIFK
jgi:hypothetical protein